SFVFLLFTSSDPPPTCTLSLHDALPISMAETGKGSHPAWRRPQRTRAGFVGKTRPGAPPVHADSGSPLEAMHATSRPIVRAAWRSEEHTSEPSHVKISYAVFCLKKKKNK